MIFIRVVFLSLSESFFRQIEMFKSEISKLKCEKLDLARQNVVSGFVLAYAVQRGNLGTEVLCRLQIINSLIAAFARVSASMVVA